MFGISYSILRYTENNGQEIKKKNNGERNNKATLKTRETGQKIKDNFFSKLLRSVPDFFSRQIPPSAIRIMQHFFVFK